MSETYSKDDRDRILALPQGWVWTKIIDVCYVNSGRTPQNIEMLNSEGDINFFKISDMNTPDNKQFMIHSKIKISYSKIIELKLKPQPEGTVIFPKRGGAIATNKKRILLKLSLYDLNLMGISPLQIPSKFMYYWLLRKDLAQLSDGSNVPQINHQDIEPLLFPLPPLPEQHRIVTKIEELFTQLDAGVASLKKVQAQLKRYRQAVHKAAFEGRLTQEWREQHKGEIEPAEVLLEKYKADLKKRSNGKLKLPLPLEIDELPQLPNQWVWTRVGEFVEIIRGASPRPAGSPRYFGGNIPWITVGELTKDENIYLKTVSSYVTEEGKKNSRYIKSDTLLLTNSGATLGVPKISLIDGCINDGSVALLGLGEIPKLYLYFFLKSQTRRLRQINQGAAQPNLNTDIVRNIILPFPPLKEQEAIVSEIEHHFSLIDHLENIIATSLRQAETLRQSILKRAFEGKLVPQDPTDELASILLERIKAEKALHAADAKIGKTLQPKSPKRKSKNGN